MTTIGLSLADIARRAGVGRPAVSNWRVRYPDFPQPIGGTKHQPIFDPAAVDRWLAPHLAIVGIRVTLPQPADAAKDPLPEPLGKLLRTARARKPGVWLLHQEIVDHGIATAHLIRRMAAAGNIERVRASFPSGLRVLIRIPPDSDAVDAVDTVDIRAVERRANTALAAVGHRVTIHPTQGGSGQYTPTKITYRGARYTGYLHTRPWTVTATVIPPPPQRNDLREEGA